MEQLDPNDLLLFARVADAGSFTRAAEQAGVPKSTLSRRITALEDRVGERLLQRTTRKLTLTEFGLALLEHARQVAAEVEAVAALAAHRQVRPSGRLRVSMPSDFANVMMVDLLAAFAALHPEVSLDIDLSPRRVDLIGENFDLALRMGDLPDDASLAARRLGTFPASLYAAPGYLAERGLPMEPADLVGHDLLRLLARSGEAIPWVLTCGERRHEEVTPAKITANSPELLIRLVQAGAGIAAVPDHYAQPHVRDGRLQRVLCDWCVPQVTAWAVFPGRRLMPAKTRAFLDMLVTGLPQLCAERAEALASQLSGQLESPPRTTTDAASVRSYR